MLSEQVNFESDPRTRFLELLGYNRNELSRKVQSLTTDAPVESNGVDAVQLAEKMASLKTDKVSDSSCDLFATECRCCL